MPQPGERYNRFMKYMMPSWSNDRKLDKGSGWNDDRCDWRSKCEVCKKEYLRSIMFLKDGLVRCEECLKQWKETTTLTNPEEGARPENINQPTLNSTL